MADIGLEGTFSPQICDGGTLMDLRKLAGNPPALGSKWYMVNLVTGECHWYKGTQRRTSYRRYTRK